MNKANTIQHICGLIGASCALTVSIMGICCESPQPKQQPVVKAEKPKPPELAIVLDDSKGEVSLKRNFYFIFDGSGSMGDKCAGEKKIDGAKEAVRAFMKKVPDDVNLGLLVFDNRGHQQMAELGADKKTFLKEIDAIIAGGGTPLAKSIGYGTDRLVEQYKKQLGYGEYRLIVVTDGEASGIPQAADYATKHMMPIYTIGLCIGDTHPLKKYAVSYRAANNFQDLQRALEETVAETETFDITDFQQ